MHSYIEEISPEIKNLSSVIVPHRNLHKVGTPRDLYNHALTRSESISRHRPKIIEAWNSNAIDSALQRQVILQDMIEAYAIQLLALDVFSTVHQSVPLQGTDKVEVSYFPLQATASQSFSKTTGYNTASDWTQQSREVVVGGDGNAATSGSNAAANTAKDRKYQMLSFFSYDVSRQPYLALQKLVQQAANKLGVDVFTDIISRVITTASFGATAKVATTAGFSADDVADLAETATGLNWPIQSRSLVLNHKLLTGLLKDPSFKEYLAYGSTDPIRKAQIQQAYGFNDIFPVPNLDTYGPAGENLVGFITHRSAVLVATAPIMPTDEVRKLLPNYQVFIDPKTGAAMTYKSFGNAVLDQASHIVEVCYGAEKGVATALQRITSA